MNLQKLMIRLSSNPEFLNKSYIRNRLVSINFVQDIEKYIN